MIDEKPIHFLSIKTMIVSAICVLGVVTMLGTLLFNDPINKRSQSIEIFTGYGNEIIINGDTTKRIYVLQDSLSGIVWVGIPGKNVLKR